MVNVLLDEEDMEIPAFLDDLVRSEDQIDEFPSVKAKIVPGKKAKKMEAPDLPRTRHSICYSEVKRLAISF